MSFYAEDPFGLIVDVHWKKKPDPPPDPEYPPPYCGRYGYGSQLETVGPDLIRGVPYGANQFPPFIGDFRTDSNVGPGGAQYGGIETQMLDPVPALTAWAYGLNATSPVLEAAKLGFTNEQLMTIPPMSGGGGVRWTVPMVSGYASGTRLPLVIKSYAITFAWSSGTARPGDEFGLGMTHPKSGMISTPPEPFQFGPQTGGSISLDYDFKWREWMRNELIVNDGNQFDPTLGGPAVLFAMFRTKFGDGSYGNWYSPGTFVGPLLGEGDWYTWEIVGTCQPQPPIF